MQDYYNNQIKDNKTKLIGQGHFASVFELGKGTKNYAVKRIKRMASSLTDLRNVKHEVEILTKIHHPNIIRLKT